MKKFKIKVVQTLTQQYTATEEFKTKKEAEEFAMDLVIQGGGRILDGVIDEFEVEEINL